MSEAVRVALAGCGAMGEIAAREVYPSLTAGGSLVAVVDPHEGRAAEAARRTGARPYGTLAEAVAGERIDAVDVRVPHHLHAQVALDAIGHGLHVLVEKPIATSVADGRAVVDAAGAAGLVLAVAENYPHLRAVEDARRVLAEGRIGRVLAVRSTRAYLLGGLWRRDGWREGDGPGGGVLLDQGTHQVSLIRRLGGEVASVSAAAVSPGTVTLTLRLDGGVVAQSILTWHSPGPPGRPEATVIGSAGRLDVIVDYEGASGGCATWTPGGADHRGAEYYGDSHTAIVNDWIGAINSGNEPRVPGREGLEDLAVVAAATTSLGERGAFVPVERPGGGSPR
ncbi:Gfo/Idh/MocA family oxidoreductase [Actinomadura sp. DC4]|uniref:Gfo/Idh/MocA family protein n=1 Tax=Actinomadura sp. DC4 TaxID=3055069 RepID=UPI0025B0DA71|nr:Gfo/Idh/MocA family oxidoreductase [Actinomadura sp. DC4]MDN3353656.1 Gfo/Idh/MocA family oxidoreductase [Actinomadura sp. DC4]